jgi:hypothetical protein
MGGDSDLNHLKIENEKLKQLSKKTIHECQKEIEYKNGVINQFDFKVLNLRTSNDELSSENKVLKTKNE